MANALLKKYQAPLRPTKRFYTLVRRLVEILFYMIILQF